MPAILTQWAAIIVTVLGGIIAWLLADARSKARLTYADERINGFMVQLNDATTRINVLETEMATSKQDRADLHRGEQRLEDTKASRDVVDGIKGDIQVLRNELSNRFDRVERLIELKSTTQR
jgi:hypothetical protein